MGDGPRTDAANNAWLDELLAFWTRIRRWWSCTTWLPQRPFGPVHALERRIMRWREIYRRDLPDELANPSPLRTGGLERGVAPKRRANTAGLH